MKARSVGTWAALGAQLGCGLLDSEPRTQFDFEIRERPELEWTQVPIDVRVATDTQSPCLRYALQVHVGFGNAGVGFELSTIDLPTDVCIPSDGPAEFTHPIGFLAVNEDNPFYLTFAHRGEVDRYVVLVSDSAIDIAPLRSEFTHPIARRILRNQ